MSFDPRAPLLVGSSEETIKRALQVPSVPVTWEKRKGPSTSPDKMAKRVKKLRAVLWMSTKQFAEFLGVSWQTVHKWTARKWTPSLKMQKKIHELEVLHAERIRKYDAEREYIYRKYPKLRKFMDKPNPVKAVKPVEKDVKNEEKVSVPCHTATRYFPSASTSRKSFIRESITRR
jgi:DNA-binding transcriptional regulator YiaG